jgi:NAD+ kinase
VATVVFLTHSARPDAGALAGETAHWLREGGHEARVIAMTGHDEVAEGETTSRLSSLLLDGVDVAVSLGGDGTFLRMAALAWSAGIPLIGVNFGRLGYLLALQPSQLRDALTGALGGTVRLEERCVLTVTTDPGRGARDGTGGDRSAEDATIGESAPVPARRWIALNEMVLEKTLFGHTVRLSTEIGGEAFLSYSADGLLVATPTGSTAYNLSAGGPVLSPDLRAMVVTPVAPHLSLDRSLVLGPDQQVSVQIEGERPAALVIDGREVGRLDPGARVRCQVPDRPLSLVTLEQRGFASLLRSTLATDRRA